MRTPREHECGDPFDSRQNDRHVRPSSRSPCPFPRPQFRSSLIFRVRWIAVLLPHLLRSVSPAITILVRWSPSPDPVRSRVSNSSASVAERVSTTSDRTVSVASQNTATTVVGVGSNTPRGEWNPKLGEAG